jgi:hypothetical protein
MTSRWKDNFKNFSMEKKVSTCYVLKIEEKFAEVEEPMKGYMERGEDVIRNNWDQD